jgi:hypothetical protein
LNRGERVLLYVANVAVGLTGVIYAWMRYLVSPADEWAVVNHPWQPQLQHLHVLTAPLLVFAVGVILSGHILSKLLNGRRARISGIVLMMLFLPMAASGYLLQVAVTPALRQLWIVVHVGASLLWIALFLVHLVSSVVARRVDQSGTDASASAITCSQLTPYPLSSSDVLTDRRQRMPWTSAGTNSERIADSTSAAEGGEKW